MRDSDPHFASEPGSEREFKEAHSDRSSSTTCATVVSCRLQASARRFRYIVSLPTTRTAAATRLMKTSNRRPADSSRQTPHGNLSSLLGRGAARLYVAADRALVLGPSRLFREDIMSPPFIPDAPHQLEARRGFGTSNPKSTAPHSTLMERVRSEFDEMSGMRLTVAQVQRLCGVEQLICTAVLDALVDAKFLYRHADGTYARASDNSFAG
jgi:hypothetical protein